MVQFTEKKKKMHTIITSLIVADIIILHHMFSVIN